MYMTSRYNSIVRTRHHDIHWHGSDIMMSVHAYTRWVMVGFQTCYVEFAIQIGKESVRVSHSVLGECFVDVLFPWQWLCQ